MLAKGLEHARIVAELSPNDYHAPWIAALLSEKLGQFDDAAAYHERAIALFPENLPLRLDAGLLYLRRQVRGRRLGNAAREEEGVRKALTYFHFVVQRGPDYAERIAGWMEENGCTEDEVAALWEGEAPAECIARARYFAAHGKWEPAAKALSAVDPGNLQTRKNDLIWYHVLRGTIDFIVNADDKAVAHWNEALALGAVRVENPAYHWMADYASRLSSESAEQAAAGLAAHLGGAPFVVNSLASKLHQTGKDLSACRLLEKTAGSTDYLCALWADSALDLGDLLTAREQALCVMRYKSAGSNWHDWLERFDARFEAKMKAAKQN